MRVVVDTNVVISAIIRPQGRTGQVLAHLRHGRYTLLTSQAALEELVDVLMRPRIRDRYGLTADDVESLLALMLLRAELVVPHRSLAVCRDPKDDKFLEIAIAGAADLIVSGDKDLLTLHPFEGIPIVTPAEFLIRLTAPPPATIP